jgi:hypothetical protein
MSSIRNQQIANEYGSKHHITERLTNEFNDSPELIKNFIDIINHHLETAVYTYTVKSGEVREWTSKLERHAKWRTMEIEHMAMKAIAMATIKELSTYTEIVGRLKGMFKHDEMRQDIESASELVALLSKTDLITIIYPRDAEEGVLMVQSNIEYSVNFAEYMDKSKFVLPSIIRPLPIRTNTDTGYRTFKGSLILSGKYHDKNVCLDHINRVNAVALRIERRAFQVEPVFKEFTSKNPDETVVERAERNAQWKILNIQTVEAAVTMMRQGNRFYQTHHYCERLRTYSHGYQLHTQGDGRRKSIIELHKQEVIDIEYS